MSDSLVGALAPDRWPALVLVTARVGGLMAVAPLWSMSTLPRLARAAVTVALALLLLPLAPAAPVPEQALDIPLPMALEFVIGTAIGLTAAVLVQGAALAGEVLSLQMSLSLGPALLPTPEAQVSGIGQLKTFLALLVYVSAGGQVMLVTGLAESLRVAPPGLPVTAGEGPRAAAALVRTLFTTALQTAAPVMVALFVTTVALAILGRAVPQLNTMMVSFPVSIAVGLVMLGASLDIVAAVMHGWVTDLPAAIRTVLDGFRPAPAVP
jgi:flagellar biosynthetic protein FliR